MKSTQVPSRRKAATRLPLAENENALFPAWVVVNRLAECEAAVLAEEKAIH